MPFCTESRQEDQATNEATITQRKHHHISALLALYQEMERLKMAAVHGVTKDTTLFWIGWVARKKWRSDVILSSLLGVSVH